MNRRTLLVAVLLLPALWQVATFARIVVSRAAYPMDIEWLEGGELYQAYRLTHGLSLYATPEQGYLPYTHPPLHPFVLALAGRLSGLDYATGRAVSILFFALACAIVAREVTRRCGDLTERLAAPLTAVACAMASFPVVGGFYDLIRNDAMALGLVLFGAALVGDGRTSYRRIVVAAAVLTAAAYTRLPYLFMSIAIGVFVLARSWRNGLLLFVCTTFAGAVILASLQYASGGWFWWFTVTVLSRHPFDGARLLDGLRAVLVFAPWLPAIPFLLAVPSMRHRVAPRTLLWCGLLAGAFPAGVLPFAKLGGFDNDLIPIVFLAGPVAVFLFLDLARADAASPSLRARWRWIGLVVASAYLAWRTYDPGTFIPDADQHRRAERLNAFVAGLDGGVIVPNHPFLPIRNGQVTPQIHTMPYLDVIGAGLGGALHAYLETSHAKWAILDGREPFVRENVISLYDFAGAVPEPVSTMVGFPSTPRLLLRRREPLPKPELRVLFDFESETYEGWTATGDAFSTSPTAGKPPALAAIVGYRGRGFASSYPQGLGDAATGTLISPPFTLDRSHLALLVGGGNERPTRVELTVDGRTVDQASGTGCDAMVPVVWDVDAYLGRQARIVIVDDDASPSGHILVDQIELFN